MPVCHSPLVWEGAFQLIVESVVMVGITTPSSTPLLLCSWFFFGGKNKSMVEGSHLATLVIRESRKKETVDEKEDGHKMNSAAFFYMLRRFF